MSVEHDQALLKRFYQEVVEIGALRAVGGK